MEREYALFFECGGPIHGNGFVANVYIRGRALAVRDEDGFSIFGVNPGGVSQRGRELAEAYSSFRESIRLILVDIAYDGRDFDDFRKDVEEFSSTSGAGALARWRDARQAARDGDLENDLEIREEKGEPEISAKVSRVDLSQVSAKDNLEPSSPLPSSLAA